MSYLEQAKNVGQALRLGCAHWGSKTSHLVPEKGEYHAVSYSELWRKITHYAAALEQLGLRSGDKLNIFSENSFAWALADFASKSSGVVTVPIYSTLPADQAQFIAQDCGARVALCGSPELAKRLEGVPDLKIVLMTDFVELAESAQMDTAAWEARQDQLPPDALATIIYTSGTTGNPKGVMLAHSNFLFMARMVKASLPMDETDTFFSFLPMSHVYEHADGHLLPTLMGATIGYAQSLATIASDLPKVRPTIMLCVPRFLDAFRSKILDGVTKAPPVRQKLFRAALDQGSRKFRGQPALLHGPLDKLVGEKVRQRVGGRLRFFVSGGAALPAHVAEFFGAFGLPVLQGYGLSETTSGMCFNSLDDNRHTTLGKPLQGAEMKIAEDGEILIRGGFVMQGYYNLPDATAQAVDAEGWFHTGDIGEQMPSGHYVLTDRKKDLLILANGKNVAPQPIENKLRESDYINEVVLFGDGIEYVCGLIVPQFDALRAFAAATGIQVGSDADLIRLEPIKAKIKSEVDRVNKGLADFEKVKRHVILPAAFTVEDGTLTPSLKVKRRIVKERFAAEIQSMMRG